MAGRLTRLPVVTIELGATIVAIFLIDAATPGADVARGLAFHAADPSLLSLATVPFGHHDVAHLVKNVTGLLLFGAVIERRFGERHLLAVAGVAHCASVLALLVASASVPGLGSFVGASGVTFGLMAYAGVIVARGGRWPELGVLAAVWTIGYPITQLTIDATTVAGAVADVAHLAGAISALALALYVDNASGRGIFRPIRWGERLRETIRGLRNRETAAE